MLTGDGSRSLRKDIADLQNADFQTLLLDSVNDAIIATNTDFLITFWNKAAERTYGWTRQEVLGRNADALFQTVFTGIDQKEAHRKLMLDKEVEVEVIHTCKDGSQINVMAKVSSICGESGQLTGTVGVLRDITRQKKIDENLAFQTCLLASVHDAIVAADENYVITYWNRMAEDLFGWKADEVLGKSSAEIFKTIVPNSSRDQAIEKMIKNDCYEGEVIYHHKDGHRIYTHVHANVLRNDNGDFKGTISSFRDITDRKQDERKALALVKELEEADKNKNRFISVLSHELRNPLAAIMMTKDLMKLTAPDSERGKQALAMQERQIAILARLVDDLLDVTRISENKIKLKKERIELNALIRRTISDYQALYDEKHVTLRLELPAEAIWLEADPTRLTQAIGNLVYNALKFSRSCGHVIISAAPDSSRGETVIQISDDGMGIDAHTMTRLFQPFAQADQALARTQGGLGLGLSIVKGIIELHGGRVQAESEGIGKGAVFTIYLPMPPGG